MKMMTAFLVAWKNNFILLDYSLSRRRALDWKQFSFVVTYVYMRRKHVSAADFSAPKSGPGSCASVHEVKVMVVLERRAYANAMKEAFLKWRVYIFLMEGVYDEDRWDWTCHIATTSEMYEVF